MIESNIQTISNGFSFSKQQGYGYVIFDELLDRPTKLTYKVDLTNTNNFGMTYNAFDSVFGNLNIYFDLDNDQIEFYRVDSNLIKQSQSEIRIPFMFNGLTELNIKVVTEGTVLIVYVNEQIAITSRAYDMANSSFGFFTLGSEVKIFDVHFYE